MGRTILLLLLGLALLVSAVMGNAEQRERTRDVSAPTAAMDEPVYPDPTNAAKVFKWGPSAWEDEFKEPGGLREDWVVEAGDGGSVFLRHGMLTVKAEAHSGTVTATPTSQAARVGRWEARVRARQFSTDAKRYQFVWELIPVGEYSCGAKSIVLASYRLNAKRVHGAVRRLPDVEFRFAKRLDLSRDYFHTYAVEVTDDHISWFVDREVIRTERRPEALSDVRYKPRFRVQAADGETMNPSWMQMDWVRHYTLARPNAKSIAAPEMKQATYADAC